MSGGRRLERRRSRGDKSDEYHFVVGPILLGSDRPLLSGVSKSLKLNLQEAKKHPSGNVTLHYTCSA
jgi:hypothetical protein